MRLIITRFYVWPSTCGLWTYARVGAGPTGPSAREPTRTHSLSSREKDQCVRLGTTPFEIHLPKDHCVELIGCAVSPTTRDQLAPLLRPKTSPVAAGCIFEVLVLPLSHMICDKELSSLNAWLSCVRSIPKSKVCPASLWLGGHGLRGACHS